MQEAIESARAFMDYTVTIYGKNGVYKEKVIVPSWVENIDIIGEDRDKTIITYDAVSYTHLDVYKRQYLPILFSGILLAMII